MKLRLSLYVFNIMLISAMQLAKAQKIVVNKQHPRLIISTADLNLMRKNALSGVEPWKSAWDNLRLKLNGYDKDKRAKVYGGDNSMEFYQAAIGDGSIARDLSIAYQITKDKRYADLAIGILRDWSDPKNKAGYYLDSTKNYPNLGMLVSRGVFTFLYAYDLLATDHLISPATALQFKDWLRVLVPHIKNGSRRWVVNDYFGKQYYQNHIIADAVGLLSIGVILRDNVLVNYAYDGKDNPRNLKKIIEGLILMHGQPPYSGEPGKWPTQDGEIMDRYRHFALKHYSETTKPNRALQYAGLSTNLLLISAEIGRLNGIDLYNWKAISGEEIKQPLLFYADFYITKDASVKGGFYSGEDSWINYNNQATFALWEVAHARYPAEGKFEDVLATNVRSSADLHLLGPVVLTHGRALKNNNRKTKL